MPTDTQIPRLAQAAAPDDYPVPANVELLLKAAFAEIDGTGATSAFIPAIELLSDSGHTIAIACDPNVKIAAGGSARVSWFPRLRTASGSSPSTGLDTGFIYRTHTTGNIASGVDTLLSFGAGTYHAGSADLFGAANYLSNPLTFIANGVVLHWIQASWGGNYNGGEVRIEAPFDQASNFTPVAYPTLQTTVSGTNLLRIHGFMVHGSPTNNWLGNSPTQIYVYANQSSGITRSINISHYMVMLPSSQQF